MKKCILQAEGKAKRCRQVYKKSVRSRPDVRLGCYDHHGGGTRSGVQRCEKIQKEQVESRLDAWQECCGI